MACHPVHLESSGAARVLGSRSRKLAFTRLNDAIFPTPKILLPGRANKLVLAMSITP
jgi:hypothetical protein